MPTTFDTLWGPQLLCSRPGLRQRLVQFVNPNSNADEHSHKYTDEYRHEHGDQYRHEYTNEHADQYRHEHLQRTGSCVHDEL